MAISEKQYHEVEDTLRMIAQWPDEAAKATGYEEAFLALRTLARQQIRTLDTKRRDGRTEAK